MQSMKLKYCIILVLTVFIVSLFLTACSSPASSLTTATSKETMPATSVTSPDTSSGWDAAKVIAELSKLPADYSSEQALQDGCYVYGIAFNGQNQVAIEFIQKAEAGKNASLRMVGYTIEGDPIFNHIDFIDQYFHVIYDGSRDKFGSFGVIEYSFKYLVSFDDNGQKVYFLVNDQTLTLAQINELSAAGQLDQFEIYRLPFVFE